MIDDSIIKINKNGEVVIKKEIIDGIGTQLIFDGELGSALSGLTVVASYVKAVVNYREIQFIFNCRLKNETESTITVANDSKLVDYELPAEIRNKIYAHNGNNCSTGSQGSVAYTHLFISQESGGYVSDHVNRFVNLFHHDDTKLSFFNEGGSVAISANTTRDLEARISLAL